MKNDIKFIKLYYGYSECSYRVVAGINKHLTFRWWSYPHSNIDLLRGGSQMVNHIEDMEQHFGNWYFGLFE